MIHPPHKPHDPFTHTCPHCGQPTAKASKAKAPPWWENVQQLRYLITGEWKKVSKKWNKDVVVAFRNQDIAALDSLLDSLDEIGVKVSLNIENPVEALLVNAQQKAMAAWVLHGKKVLKIRNLTKYPEDYANAIAITTARQVQEFTKTYPGRMLHPEIVKQIEYLQSGQLTTVQDVSNLADRMAALLTNRPDIYFENMSSVQVGRLWHGEGMLQAEANGIKTGQVVGPEDKAKCPVCWRFLGTHVDIQYAAKQWRENSEIADRDEYVAAWPFPRIGDVDGLPSKEIERSGFFPPYHCRCRDSIVWLVKENVKPVQVPQLPPSLPVVPVTPDPVKPETLGNRIFNEKSHAELFDEKYEAYSKLSPTKLKNVFKKKFQGFWKITLNQWAGNTTTPGATVLKLRAAQLEKLSGKVKNLKEFVNNFDAHGLQGKALIDKVIQGMESFAAPIDIPLIKSALSEETYISWRAFTRAYLDKKYKGVDEVVLYRGTDGGTGMKISKTVFSDVLKGKQKRMITLSEDALVGYSDSVYVAKSFGTNAHGIVAMRKIHKDDIIAHPDFFSIMNEREFIVRNLGTNTEIPIADTMFVRSRDQVARVLGLETGELKGAKWQKLYKWLTEETLQE